MVPSVGRMFTRSTAPRPRRPAVQSGTPSFCRQGTGFNPFLVLFSLMSSTGGPRSELSVQQWFASPSNRVYAAQQEGTDPTRTKTLRARYAAHAYRLLRELKGDIRHVVVDQDAFGLTAPSPPEPTPLVGQAHFDFPQDADKVDAFMDWVEQREKDGFLETRQAAVPGRPSSNSAWADTYIRSSYQKGVTHAQQAAASAGMPMAASDLDSVFRAHRHADAIGLIYTRNYRELNGVTEAMNQQMSRTLADGLVQGHGPRRLARDLNSAVDLGMTRSRVVAHTEMIRTFSEATLNRYADLGIDAVEAQVELLTAGDNRVCDDCKSLEGDVMSLDDARGVIPRHPRCRCAWLPVI